ncbi:FAD-dependent oxidoreductase [Chitinophaga agrisoli]|uniref:Tryptophan 2-monooxygenase n=1 Tax=Chitinophaga agrisoli TaxID=2607653 RepID=A0A5B2VWR7_9BACT|nr:NAD(P)/FAD-dependent oxidoreductase [Chitinophaga agrisoli]KAA2243214.1 FAD-dependent oxidoreductase [Chitinophaga agrisoli]
MATTLIIGAGAAGLMAARELTKAGRQVILLEARDHIGGRMHGHTGAEFVHGDLPVTIGLLQEAGIPYNAITGVMWQYVNGQLSPVEDWIIPHWPDFVKALRSLQQDMPLQDFLTQYFPEDKYADLRDMVLRYACGYDTAEPADASTMAMREEWLSEKDAEQYRIVGGYDRLTAFLEADIRTGGGVIKCQTVVKELHWQPGQVTAVATDGLQYNAQHAIITLPFGVLQAPAGAPGSVQFVPALPAQQAAAQQMGMGGVIKILLHFQKAFWEEHPVGDDGSPTPDLSMIFSKEAVPTWWTQQPERSTLLTGWLGGPPARELKDASTEHILQMALASLGAIFNMPVTALQSLLQSHDIINWTADPFTRGSYTYPTVQTKAALPVLSAPVANTLYFAGEGFYEGPEMGTVEAALTSGKAIAGKICELV